MLLPQRKSEKNSHYNKLLHYKVTHVKEIYKEITLKFSKLLHANLGKKLCDWTSKIAINYLSEFLFNC